MWPVRFAWFPVRASKRVEYPGMGDFWGDDGWLFWEGYELVTNIYGEKFRVRCA